MNRMVIEQIENGVNLLKIENLSVNYKAQGNLVRALDDVSLSIKPKEFTAVVGESGSGKSTLALSVTRLLPSNASYGGSIFYKGREITKLTNDEMTRLRGTEVSMIFQEPLSSLIPVRRIGDQMAEAIRIRESREGMKVEIHDRSPGSVDVQSGGFASSRFLGAISSPRLLKSKHAEDEVIRWLSQVRIPDPERVAEMYSFELSGGMVQRVMIAMALSLKPSLLLADEPTTALDVTTQAQILKLMRGLADDTGTAVLLVTHDLGVAAQIADRIVVMYAGQVVEEARTDELFANPLHPYTQGLIRCYPKGSKSRDKKLDTIPGSIPDLTKKIEGCKFCQRCSFAREICAEPGLNYIEASKEHYVRCTLY